MMKQITCATRKSMASVSPPPICKRNMEPMALIFFLSVYVSTISDQVYQATRPQPLEQPPSPPPSSLLPQSTPAGRSRRMRIPSSSPLLNPECFSSPRLHPIQAVVPPVRAFSRPPAPGGSSNHQAADVVDTYRSTAACSSPHPSLLDSRSALTECWAGRPVPHHARSCHH